MFYLINLYNIFLQVSDLEKRAATMRTVLSKLSEPADADKDIDTESDSTEQYHPNYHFQHHLNNNNDDPQLLINHQIARNSPHHRNSLRRNPSNFLPSSMVDNDNMAMIPSTTMTSNIAPSSPSSTTALGHCLQVSTTKTTKISSTPVSTMSPVSPPPLPSLIFATDSMNNECVALLGSDQDISSLSIDRSVSDGFRMSLFTEIKSVFK